jgi:UTP--glucose-1-phosphate uridylyltransferase
MHGSDQVRKAIIPVGGLGTRLLPLTKVLPKELLPVGRRPVIQYVVEEMRAAGFEHICLVTGRKKTLIQEHFDHDPELLRHLQDRGRDDLLGELAYLESGLQLTFIRQSGPQGLADAVSLAEGYVGDQPFAVALGDSIICEPEAGGLLRTMMEKHLETGAEATLAVEAVPSDKPRSYGMVYPEGAVMDTDEVFPVADLPEKPRLDQGGSNWATAARYVFSPSIFSAIRSTRPERGGETHLSDAIRILLGQGAPVQAVRLSREQRRHDLGTFDGYFRTFFEFVLQDPDYAEEMRSVLAQALRQQPDQGL